MIYIKLNDDREFKMRMNDIINDYLIMNCDDVTRTSYKIEIKDKSSHDEPTPSRSDHKSCCNDYLRVGRDEEGPETRNTKRGQEDKHIEMSWDETRHDYDE